MTLKEIIAKLDEIEDLVSTLRRQLKEIERNQKAALDQPNPFAPEGARSDDCDEDDGA